MVSDHVSPWHLWHRWSKWSVAELVTFTRPLVVVTSGSFVSVLPDGVEVTREEQRRACIVCGAEEVRVVA